MVGMKVGSSGGGEKGVAVGAGVDVRVAVGIRVLVGTGAAEQPRSKLVDRRITAKKAERDCLKRKVIYRISL